MRGVFISVWPVRCWLCQLQVPTPTPTNIEEHKGSAIRNHLREQHDMEPEDIAQNVRILRKCQNKFDYLILKCFFYQKNETNAKQTVGFNLR